MLVAATVFAVSAALFHVVAFVLESVLWMRPAVFRRFGIVSQDEANTLKTMAYNQGFYNLALGLGVLVGVVMLWQTGNTFIAGKAVIVFGTAGMSSAGLVLASSGPSYLRSACAQFFPSALALGLTLAT